MKVVAALTVLAAGMASAQTFDPRDHRDFAGPATQIMVLGTAHLSGLPKSFAPAHLTPVIERMAAWKPDAIAIEAVSGVQCEELRQYDARHDGAAESYCWDPAPARAATGLDVRAATLEADRLLADWPATPTAVQRRHLAAVFLAGGEPTSALVQWLHLPACERRVGDGLDQTLVDRLEFLRQRVNENYLLAAPLAVRLGLQRVFAVDDHSADTTASALPGFGDAIQKAWDVPANVARKKAYDEWYAALGTPTATLDLYRRLNMPGEGSVVFASDFGAALKDPGAPHYGRYYVGWWETRNLRMVANVRAVAATRPGMRLLAIVGASHKPYYEAYLTMMHDVKIADVEAALR